MTRDEVALLLLAIGALAFVAWELAGVLPGTPIHTISFLAYKFAPLKYLILIGFVLLPVWWVTHLSTEPPK